MTIGLVGNEVVARDDEVSRLVSVEPDFVGNIIQLVPEPSTDSFLVLVGTVEVRWFELVGDGILNNVVEGKTVSVITTVVVDVNDLIEDAVRSTVDVVSDSSFDIAVIV